MSTDLTNSSEWSALERHQKKTQDMHLRDLFTKDKGRFEKFHITLEGMLFDYSKNNITQETCALLVQLAEARKLGDWRQKLFKGDIVNPSEDRAAAYPALRQSTAKDVVIDNENVADFISETLMQMESACRKIRGSGHFTDIVHIGIGGSYLGPRLAYEALKPFADGPRLHFIANIDGAEIQSVLQNLTPQKTLFTIASKTFTTLETIANAESAKKWIEKSCGKEAVSDHFIAITTNKKAAEKFGIAPENILPMREWIGGRYSLWSAIGFPVALAIGFDNFRNLLAGAKAMDAHFLKAPLDKNIPVLHALLSIWHRNFCDYRAQAIIPYAENLRCLPPYLQQLDMESNGKNSDKDGTFADYKTGGIIFGGTGTNTQHAFFQLLHQGTEIVPCDFIIVAQPEHNMKDHHVKLVANAIAQSQALMQGIQNEWEPHRHFPGNRPSTTIILERLTPYYLGMLLALYEHKAFVQSIIWNINCFDQWGVELGKILAKDIEQAFEDNKKISKADSSTQALVKYLQKKV